MNSIILELQNHIDKGIHLLSAVPSKTKYAQRERAILGKSANPLNPFQNQVSTQAKQQVEILRKEYNQKKSLVNKEYNSWFDDSLESLQLLNEINTMQQFQNSKNHIDLHTKINSGIKILEQSLDVLKNDSEKQNKINIEKAKKIDLKKQAWETLIQNGENDQVEFKSSLRWDYKGNNLNKHLEIPVIKSIAAFLNSKGGTLFIGINDQKEIIGLTADYPTLKRQDGDGFIQYLLQIVGNALGKEFNKFISMNIATIAGKEICVIEIAQSDKPVFMKHNNKEEFYIRASLSSQPLNVRETVEYVKMHFKEYVHST